MPNIFDLSKISHLVETQHPARILVMDTNVLMNEPDAGKWEVSAAGQTLFVLSATSNFELEHIKQKRGAKEQSQSLLKAETAIKSLADLFKQGVITEGIRVNHGWVIGVPSPRKNELAPELEQLEDIVKAYKPSDTKLLLLTKECHQLFQSTPVALLTADGGLYGGVQMQGLPCHLCTGFPIKGLKEAAATTNPINWDQMLTEMQSETKQKAVVVEATLTAQSLAQPWLALVTGTKKFTIAEGRGVLRLANEVKSFLWTVLFYPQTIETGLSDDSDDNEGLTDLPSIHLDFFGEDNFGQDLFDSIADRILDCTQLTFEEGKPTLQNPESVMEMLLFFEYIFRKSGSETAKERLRQEINKSEGLVHYWTDWILNTEDEDERSACLEGFIEALNNCWKIGQTYTFSIIRREKEEPE